MGEVAYSPTLLHKTNPALNGNMSTSLRPKTAVVVNMIDNLNL